MAWSQCIQRIQTDKQTAMMVLVAFFMILAIVAMLILMAGSNQGNYKSELREITDKISTPVPCGEKQHGSARWMQKSEYDKSFGSALLPLNKGMLAELMAEGKSDLAFVKEGQKQTQKKGKQKEGNEPEKKLAGESDKSAETGGEGGTHTN